MSILEEKIRKNREYFDVHEPSGDHLDKFQDKIGMKQEGKTRQLLSFGIVWKVAAVILIILGVTFLYPDSNISNSGALASMVMETEDPDEELEELRNYFNHQKERKIEQLNALACDDSNCEELKEFAQKELEGLEKNNETLEEDLVESNDDERVTKAIVNNYQLMTRVLDNVIDQIKASKD